MGGCVYMQSLCEALKYATSLQDLRYGIDKEL